MNKIILILLLFAGITYSQVNPFPVNTFWKDSSGVIVPKNNKSTLYFKIADTTAFNSKTLTTAQLSYKADTSSVLWKDSSGVIVPKNYGNIRTDIIYKPNQTDFVGTLIYGTGGDSLNSTGTNAGEYNTYIGIGSGDSSKIAKKNTATGWNSLNKTQSGWANSAFGYNVLSAGVGTGSLDISGTGIEFYANSGFGSNALSTTTTGSYLSAFGVNALLNNTTGSYNNAFGVHALDSNRTGNYNNAFGNYALYKSNGDNNVAIGHGAFYNKRSGSNAIAIGYNAGYSDTGIVVPSIYFGGQAGYYNVSGGWNTIFGHQSAFGVTGNSHIANTTLGYKSLYTVTTGSFNVVIGCEAGNRLTSGTYNTFLGFNAGKDNQKVDANNTIALGNGTYTTADNQVVIGNGNVTTVLMSQDSGATIYSGKTSWNDSLFTQKEASKIDSATIISLETGKAGWGEVMIGDAQEWATFHFTSAGVVTLRTNSTNVSTTPFNPNTLNIYDAGSGVAIQNYLSAAQKKIAINIKYFTP